MEELPFLSKTRRLVTGHSATGEAIFEHDEELVAVNPVPSNSSGADNLKAGVTLIHRTRNYPVDIQGSADELARENLRRGRGEKGIVCQIVHFPPSADGTKLYMHRNQSLDYGVVLKGAIELILDGGAVETIREGEVYVQRGTNHAWRNPGPEWCRFLTVIIPSEPVRTGNHDEALTATAIPGLSD